MNVETLQVLPFLVLIVRRRIHSPGWISCRAQRTELAEVSLLRTRSGVLVHIEEKYGLPELHVNFSKEETTAQLHGPSTGNRSRSMLEGESYYAADMVFPYFA